MPIRRRLLTSDDVQQGCVLWLPALHEVKAKHPGDYALPFVRNLTTPSEIPREGFYGHPILVLWRPATAPETIRFLPMTTFRGRSLEERFGPCDRHGDYGKQLAMEPHDRHPLWQGGREDAMYAPLRFQGGPPTSRGSFLTVSAVYEMKWEDAEVFWTERPAAPARLDRQSLDRTVRVVCEMNLLFMPRDHLPLLRPSSSLSSTTMLQRSKMLTPPPLSPMGRLTIARVSPSPTTAETTTSPSLMTVNNIPTLLRCNPAPPAPVEIIARPAGANEPCSLHSDERTFQWAVARDVVMWVLMVLEILLLEGIAWLKG